MDNDSLAGGLGDDSIFGGIGEDTILGGDGNDRLFGGIGNDRIDGGADNDAIEGGDGNDTVIGGSGADNILGNDGDDSLMFGDGDDTVFGGRGNDVIDDVAGDRLQGVNLLYGGEGNDTVWAGFGNDSIFGDEGNDVLFGEEGADSIYGGAGADRVSGDVGNDEFFFSVGDVDSAAGADTVFGGGGAGIAPDDFDTIDVSDFGGDFGWKSVVIVRGSEDPDNPLFENGTISLYTADPANGGQLIGRILFENIEAFVICFTPGTMILTDRGEVAVETLHAGDMVMTRDNGLQPLRWVGQRKVSRAQLVLDPDLRPVRIARGALGPEGPAQSMMVSPQHRVLVTGGRAELLFGTDEVLVPAKHLVGQVDATRVLPDAGVTYIHILFDRHEIVQSDGIWTESFQPAERSLNAMEAAVRDEILKLFPELASDTSAYLGARLSLKAHEVRVLLAC